MQSHLALIVSSHGNQGLAELDDGRQLQCTYRRGVGRPVCGDRVLLGAQHLETNPVDEILPRSNIFVRGQRDGSKQVMAANLDQVIIVIAPEPAPSRDLLDRYLVAAQSLGIPPLVVVNKAELLASLRGTDSGFLAGPFRRLEDYRSLGYAVLETSCKVEPGVGALRDQLRGKTSIVVGQSGVGKSSLVNALVPDLDLQTQALSDSTGKGRHTTTTTMMFHLPGGGRLVDSPGVWEYGLWKMDREELQLGFPEFSKVPGYCRFNNCQHNGEPACAIAAAADAGLLPAWRLDTYRRLLAQGGSGPGQNPGR
jgi:ribosome biogenesis GTPase